MEGHYCQFRPRKFGVELEVSPTTTKERIGMMLTEYESAHSARRVVVTEGKKGWAETRKNNYWHVKYDSTCGPMGKGIDYGWEVASYVGHTAEDIDLVAGAAEHLHKWGLKTNKNCGLHVHIDVSDYDEYDMGVLLAYWVKIEPILYGICDQTRLANVYCAPLSRRLRRGDVVYESPVEFWNDIRPRNLKIHNNKDKRVSLNTINYVIGRYKPHYDRKTVELRLPECRLDREHVANWVALIMNLVDWCSCREPPDNLEKSSIVETMQILGIQGDSSVFFFLDERLMRLKKWFLTKIQESWLLTVEHKDAAKNCLALLK